MLERSDTDDSCLVKPDADCPMRDVSSRFVKKIPLSAGAPSYKLSLPHRYVQTCLVHLVGRNIELATSATTSKTWDASVVPRRNKDRSEYTLKGWKLFAEANQIQTGDQYAFELIDDKRLVVSMMMGGSTDSESSSGGAFPPVTIRTTARALPQSAAPCTSGSEHNISISLPGSHWHSPTIHSASGDAMDIQQDAVPSSSGPVAGKWDLEGLLGWDSGAAPSQISDGSFIPLTDPQHSSGLADPLSELLGMCPEAAMPSSPSAWTMNVLNESASHSHASSPDIAQQGASCAVDSPMQELEAQVRGLQHEAQHYKSRALRAEQDQETLKRFVSDSRGSLQSALEAVAVLERLRSRLNKLLPLAEPGLHTQGEMDGAIDTMKSCLWKFLSTDI